MKFSTVITAIVIMGIAADRAEAANLAVIVSPPSLMSLVILGLAVAGVVFGIQLLRVVKGGFLSRAWQVFVACFALLAISQLTSLIRATEIAAIPIWVPQLLMVLWAGSFFYAVFETKRALT
jgi:hypothetical protein